MNVQTYSSWSRMLDCNSQPPGTYSNRNNVLIAVTAGGTGQPDQCITTPNSGSDNNIMSNTVIGLGSWNHLAGSLSGTTGSLYLNANLVATGTQPVPISVTRSYCYIGLSYYTGDGVLNSYVDDITIFNRALTATEITSVYNYVG